MRDTMEKKGIIRISRDIASLIFLWCLSFKGASDCLECLYFYCLPYNLSLSLLHSSSYSTNLSSFHLTFLDHLVSRLPKRQRSYKASVSRNNIIFLIFITTKSCYLSIVSLFNGDYALVS